jgi:hypothetical protein
MRKLVRRRLELESLESITLLSGVSTAAHDGIAALIEHVPEATHRVALSGTVTGTFSAAKVIGGPYQFTAKGNVTPLGSVKVTGSIQVLLATHPFGTMIIKTPNGNIDVRFAETKPSPLGGTVSTEITGGTGKYQFASGIESGSISIIYNHGTKAPVLGTFEVTFVKPPAHCASC